ncbi:DUF1826 domain-containing protein [Winogradskyella sp.]|uniref:DUF1826 domain-containing protein n=1 Tax=Winogradskyella sp. TaxID=1883156 RepID=UPI003BA88710
MISLQSLIGTKKRFQDFSSETAQNWVEGTRPKILEDIHQKHVNITVYNRDIYPLKKEISSLVKCDITFDSRGTLDVILKELTIQIKGDENILMMQDIQNLLQHFKAITKAKRFRLFLATIDTNMCRKFHMDFNVLRMLCTYSGPGTLWLTEDNIDREALEAYGSNACIVIDQNRIKQAKTGSVVVLKGAKYSKKMKNGAVHRSPTIEERSEKRLLLRIDMI